MPTLDSISLDLSQWSPHQRDERMAVWVEAEGDVLAVNYFPCKPDIPPPSEGAAALRDYFRQQCADQGGGIVEVDVVTIRGIECGKLVVKSRMQPTGFTFQGTCVVPRRDFSFVIRVQCVERGTTGMRESAVMVIEQPKPEYEEDANPTPHPLFPGAVSMGRIKGWFKDPYDARFDSIALRTLADQEKYDESFPDHPLSRARRRLRSVIETMGFSRDILEAPAFRG
jgi:hypothetical protein